MIKHLRHNEIDKAQWDVLLLQCSDRLWYMQSWVLDVSCPGWEALMDVEHGAIMPLLWRRKLGVDYLYQPYGMQQQGVFAKAPNAELHRAFLQEVPSRFKYWDIHVNSSMHVPPLGDLNVEENTNQTLVLDRSIDTMRAAYSTGHRRNVRKAVEAFPEVFEDLGIPEFVSLFQRTTGSRFASIPEGGLVLLRKLMELAKQKGQCRITSVNASGAAIAAICFMEWEGRCILLKAAADEAGKEQRAMFRLVDQCIAHHAGSGMILDFAGSNTESVARFNAGFGAVSSVYLHLHRNRLPAPLRWIKR